MTEVLETPGKTPGRRPWLTLKTLGCFGALVALLAVTAVAVYVFLIFAAQNSLRDAIAEADHLDPAWRLEDLEAKRQADMIPWGEDATACVLEVLELIPEDWLSLNPEIRKADGPFLGKNLEEALDLVAPNILLGPDFANGLEDEMSELAQALQVAARLSNLSRGRNALEYQDVIFNTLLPNTQNSRKVARLLKLASFNHAQRGDLDEALDGCRAIIGVSDSIGDEPFTISQLVRLSDNLFAAKAFERVLAQGEPSDSALERAQHRVVEESKIPFALIAFRGERASFFDVLGKIAREELPISALSDRGSSDKKPQAPFAPHGRAFFQYNQGLSLNFLTRAVEIVKLHPHEQLAPWKAWEKMTRKPEGWKLYRGAMTYLLLPSIGAFHLAYLRTVALLNVTQTMIAMERSRILLGRWPTSLDEIPRAILPENPIDPFSGQHVKIARTNDGWIVYSVGPDGIDDGGKLDPRFDRKKERLDWGYQLWDVSERRLLPDLPDDVFQNTTEAASTKNLDENP